MSTNVIDAKFTDVLTNTPNVNDSGYFVELMTSIKAHIAEEHSSGRITGTDYATVYLGSLQFALQEATKFALSLEMQNQQAELTEAQQRLTEAKIISEGKQQAVIDNQAALYEAQALAFKYRHKKDLAKLHLDAWTIISTGSDVYATDANTQVFGNTIADAVADANWTQ